jgi:CubicO group peptidase (beta-lactamase class C family)
MAEEPEDVRAVLEEARKKYKLPALGVALVAAGKVETIATVGVRKWGDPTPVTDTDPFHLGSNTKTMTATLAAILVVRGKLRWETTLADVFPEAKAAETRPVWRDVTLRQLLNQRSGMPSESFPGGGAIWSGNRRPILEQRVDYVRRSLSDEPDSPPGTKFLYSNRGYVVAGAMLERVMGESWETLMRRHLFEPLNMTSAGFGSAAKVGEVNAPYPHQLKDDLPTPVVATADNPPVLGPGGRVHASFADWGKFALLHLSGIKGASPLLTENAVRTLHTPPPGGEYAMGWVVLERSWGGGTVLYHNGDNTMNYAVMWLAPRRDFAVLAATNISGRLAIRACDDIAGRYLTTLGRRFGG